MKRILTIALLSLCAIVYAQDDPGDGGGGGEEGAKPPAPIEFEPTYPTITIPGGLIGSETDYPVKYGEDGKWHGPGGAEGLPTTQDPSGQAALNAMLLLGELQAQLNGLGSQLDAFFDSGGGFDKALEDLWNDIWTQADERYKKCECEGKWAAKDHTHTEYADKNHTHTEYAEVNHTHTEYADKNHTHSEYATESRVYQVEGTLSTEIEQQTKYYKEQLGAAESRIMGVINSYHSNVPPDDDGANSMTNVFADMLEGLKSDLTNQLADVQSDLSGEISDATNAVMDTLTSMLEGYVTEGELEEALADYLKSGEIDTKIANAITEHLNEATHGCDSNCDHSGGGGGGGGGSVTNVYVCECNGGEGCGCGNVGNSCTCAAEGKQCTCQIKTAQDVNDAEIDPIFKDWKDNTFAPWKSSVDADIKLMKSRIYTIQSTIGTSYDPPIDEDMDPPTPPKNSPGLG